MDADSLEAARKLFSAHRANGVGRGGGGGGGEGLNRTIYRLSNSAFSPSPASAPAARAPGGLAGKRTFSAGPGPAPDNQVTLQTGEEEGGREKKPRKISLLNMDSGAPLLNWSPVPEAKTTPAPVGGNGTARVPKNETAEAAAKKAAATRETGKMATRTGTLDLDVARKLRTQGMNGIRSRAASIVLQ